MATALELRRTGWKHYVDALRRRPEPPDLTPGEREMREGLLGQVRAAAHLLKTRFGADRVVLFGSLAHEAWFSREADVDLAVEGLKSGAYWEAWGQIEEMMGNHAVDLVEMETAREPLRRAIEHYGIEL